MSRDILQDSVAATEWGELVCIVPSGMIRQIFLHVQEEAKMLVGLSAHKIMSWSIRQDLLLTEHYHGLNLSEDAVVRCRKILRLGEGCEYGKALAESGATADAVLLYWLHQYAKPPRVERLPDHD
jgi:hypothetical protein